MTKKELKEERVYQPPVCTVISMHSKGYILENISIGGQAENPTEDEELKADPID